jgi:crossover junction endodeoxyribonuclease RuvC
MNKAIRILGIDPGLRKTGWGIIVQDGARLSFVACGSVMTGNALSTAERLRQIHDGLALVIREHAPDEAAVEETFVNKDAQATLKLGHARGVALLVPALSGLTVSEYAANLVKKTVVGSGHADKKQIGVMIKVLLPRSDATTEDAADALAIAITHAQHRTSRDLLHRALR